MRWASLVASALFLVCAVIQYNDPDPFPWIALYTAAATVSLASLGWARPASRMAIAVGAIAAAWAIAIVPGAAGISPAELVQPMDTKGGAVEIGREVGGLALVVAWMIVVAVTCGREPEAPTRPPRPSA